VTGLTEELARRAVDRTVAERQGEYVAEMRRIVAATYQLIARTGSLEPSLREILRETGLSTQGFYRFFQSKDELLLLLLDDGRRQLASYLFHRIDRATTPEGGLRAWVEGVLAQAKQPEAALRTRPFVAGEHRLAEAFPDEHRACVDLFVDQLTEVLESAPARPRKRRADLRRDAQAIYELTFGALHRHLLRGTVPTAAEIDHLVAFSLRGAGVGTKG
jgi:AcrR family transcriptional regulator